MRFITDSILNLSAAVASSTSETLNLDTILNCSVTVKWTSTTASFTINMEVSNDGVDWFVIDFSTIANNNGTDIYIIQNNPYRYARVSVVRTSGTATTITATYHGKGF